VQGVSARRLQREEGRRINPLRVRAQNYRSFAELDLELPVGVTAIVGPNGAGKSSILDAIDLALFADRGELARKLTRGEDTLWLELEFEHGGTVYRVRRRYDAGGRGSSGLDFERQDDAGAWEPLTLESIAATQARVDATLGLSRATFRASAFVGQGDGAAFTDASPSARKAILSEILSLDVWPRARERVHADKLEQEYALVRARTRVSELQAVVDERPAHEAAHEAAATVGVPVASGAVEQAETTLAEARAALAAQDANVERARSAEQAFRHASARQAERARQKQQLEREAVLLRADLERRRREQDEAGQRIEELRARGADPGEVCDRCRQPLDDAQAAEAAAASYRAEADRLEAARREAALRRLTDVGRLGEIERRVRDLADETDADRDAAEAAERLQAARDALGDVAALRRAAEAAQDAVAHARAALDRARADVVRAALEIERCQDAEQALAETVAGMAAMEERLDLLALLERMFGRDGVPAWLIERFAIPQIETSANRILADYGQSYRVELRTQRALKGGGERETLEIVVHDGMYEGDYADFSGGERTRLDHALRIALAELLANRRGAENRVLCIDEPDGLDAAGMDRLADRWWDVTVAALYVETGRRLLRPARRRPVGREARRPHCTPARGPSSRIRRAPVVADGPLPRLLRR
jgi:DNA repair exonuclease SbcCD ATPase subunit